MEPKCRYLNDRVVEGEAINAKCECPDIPSCPKQRSTKKAVTGQCWHIQAIELSSSTSTSTQ